MNIGAKRPLAQILTITFIVLSLGCCTCGILLASLSLQPLPGDEVILPNGQVADATDQLRVGIITLCLSTVIALTILFLGLGIWFVYGKDKSQTNLTAQAISVFLLIASISIFLWTGLVIITALLTDGMTATGQTLGARQATMVSFACLVPAAVSALASLVVWFLFVRQKDGSERRALPEKDTELISVEAYLTFMQRVLQREGIKNIDASIEARTRLTLRQATTEDKIRIILFLYESNLINSEPLVSLRSVNLRGLNLTGTQLAGINMAGADLTGSDLHNANVANANLQEAILRDADLRFANLTAVNLQNANLIKAKLHGVTLRGANLNNANLTQANLWQADLTNSQITAEQLASVKSLNEATLPNGSKASSISKLQ